MRHGLTPDLPLYSTLTLSCSGLSATVVARLLASFGTPQDVLAASRSRLQQCGFSAATIKRLLEPPQDKLDKALQWASETQNHLIDRDNRHYPRLLLEIPDPPPLLYVSGNPALLNLPQLAIVGSRKATHTALKMTQTLSATLATSGLCITSGMAHGIDAKAHAGCLDAGASTIAVLGTGTDRCYPLGNRKLYRRILDTGALLSEFPPGTPPIASNFPRRNRIISGLSLGTLVVEAAARSGSLITARLAMEQNREVFAVPGSVLNPLSSGCHQLIRQGAKLVENPQDILDELSFDAEPAPTTTSPAEASPTAASQEASREQAGPPTVGNLSSTLLNCLGYEPITLDTLCQRTGSGPAELLPQLLTLELNGAIATLSGGRYIRC